jgi:phytoene dehydrogenase-like protein
MATVDAVVIGAGHNGLVAANLLADAGWDVVVLEATPHVGGAVRSAELAAPGYLSDVCSAFYPLGAASPVLRGLRLEEHGLRWTHAPHVLAHLTPDGRVAILDRDPEVTAASVERFAPGDGERWLRLYDQWRPIGEGVLEGMLRPFPPVRAGAAVARRLRAADLLRLARLFLSSAQAFAEERFDGDGARLLLAGLALHTDLSPGDAGGAAFGWVLAMTGQQYGFPAPEGGARCLTDALVARLESRGGAVVTETPVERVVVGGGRALGVRCAGGRHWRARRAVLADVPAPALYQDLVGADHLPPRLVEDLRGFRWDHTTLKVDWALSGRVPWTAGPARGAGTLHLAADMGDLLAFSAALAGHRVPECPFLVAGQMTTTDPGRSPAGTESMWAYTHLPGWPSLPDDVVAAQVERVESVIEAHAPGFRGLVVGRHVEVHPAGAVNGGTAAIAQQLVFRPVPGLGRADTPVDRLYLAGAGGHPGGGVHGAPGANAARAALARARPLTGDAYAAVVRGAQAAIYRRSGG